MGWEEHLRGRQLSQNTSAFLVCMRLEAPQRAAPDLHTLNVIIMGDHQKKEIYFYAVTHETNCIKHFDQAGFNLIQICNIVINWGDPPPLCNIVINQEHPSPPILYYVIYGQPLIGEITFPLINLNNKCQ